MARRLRWGWAWAAALPWLVGLLFLGSGAVLGLRRLGYSAAPVLGVVALGALGIAWASGWRGRRVALADAWVRLDRGLGLGGALVAAVDGRGQPPPPPAARLRYPWRPRRFAALGLAAVSFFLCWLVPQRELRAARATTAAGAPLSWQRSRQLIEEAGAGPEHGLRPELVAEWRRAIEELEASTPAGERFSPASLEAGAALNRKMASDLSKSRAALEEAAASLRRPGAGAGGAQDGSLQSGRQASAGAQAQGRGAEQGRPQSGVSAGQRGSAGAQGRAGRKAGGAGQAQARRGSAGARGRGRQGGSGQGAQGGAGLEALPQHLKAQLRAAQQAGGKGQGQQGQALGQQLSQMSSTLQEWESQLRPMHGSSGAGARPGEGEAAGAAGGSAPGRGGGSAVLVLKNKPGAALPATPKQTKPRDQGGQLGDRIREHRYQAEVNEGRLAPQAGGDSAGSAGGAWVWPEQQLSVEERARLQELRR